MNEKITEIVFIIDMPACLVIGMLKDQCPEKRKTCLAGNQTLLQNVGNECVAQSPPALHDVSDGGVMPRFALVGAVVADV